MEPKYLAFRRWLYTPIIIWQGDWICRDSLESSFQKKKNSFRMSCPALHEAPINPKKRQGTASLSFNLNDLSRFFGWTKNEKSHWNDGEIFMDISRFDCPVCRQLVYLLVCLLLIGLSYFEGIQTLSKLRHLCQIMVTQDSVKKNEHQISYFWIHFNFFKDIPVDIKIPRRSSNKKYPTDTIYGSNSPVWSIMKSQLFPIPSIGMVYLPTFGWFLW